MTTTPISLLERLGQPDDSAAWDRFVRLYTPLMFRWLIRTGMQEADVADLIQDVFAVLVRRLPDFRYDQDKSFHRWLYAIVMNRWRDRLKQRTPGQLPADPPAPDDLDSFIEREYRDHLLQQIWTLLEADFTPETVHIFRALILEGKPAPDVAARHGVSLGAVYAAKHRVLARIRHEFAGLI